MTCLLVTLLIYFAYYYIFSTASSEIISRKILLSFVMCCAQIIMTELILGLCHNLYISSLIIANLVIAFLLLLSGYRLRKQSFLAAVKTDIDCLKQAATEAKDVYTVTLGILVLATYVWILIAAYYLPPRGIDDLVYHLPTIFDYIQSHEIRLLSVELRHHFAFPQNAELLFMWPTIFAGNQRMADSVNIPFVFFSILTVYSLLRHFEITRKDALFASMLYALCPVVIFQAGVNYIDIIVSLFFLLSLYFSLLFHSSRKITYLFATGISIGLMLGMKYTALLLVLPLLVLIVPGLFIVKKRAAIGYVALIVVLSSWWYLRNLVVLKDPFYPYNFLGPLFGRPGGGGLLNSIIANLQHWTSSYLIEDIGIGTYEGGFGLFFWGIGFSSWLYIVVYSLLHINKTGLSRFIVLACLPVGFILLLAVPVADVPHVGRMAMFVVAVGSFSFCETIKVLNDKVCISILKIVCVVLSIITLSLMFDSIKPSYKLGDLFADRIRQNFPSEFKYISNAPRTRRAAHGYVWESLDFLTRDDKKGLNCALINDPGVFMPAAVYGSNLQNRIAYSHNQAYGLIEAYIGTFYAGFHDIKLDDVTSSYDVLSSSDYTVVSHWNYSCLILHKNIFNNPDKQQLLAKYYKNTWPEAINTAMQIAPLLNENIPIITSSHIGYGLRYVDISANRADRIVMVPNHQEENVASSRKFIRCYTFNKPLSDYRFTQISRVIYKNSETNIYLNWKP